MSDNPNMQGDALSDAAKERIIGMLMDMMMGKKEPPNPQREADMKVHEAQSELLRGQGAAYMMIASSFFEPARKRLADMEKLIDILRALGSATMAALDNTGSIGLEAAPALLETIERLNAEVFAIGNPYATRGEEALGLGEDRPNA